MKIPLEWLKQYINTRKTTKELAESFTAIGLMLDKPVSSYANDKYTTEVLDLEHRMDRSDWLAILGCARDLAAYENIDLKLPEYYESKPKPLAEGDKIRIEVLCPELINRFNTRIFKNVNVKPSPDWLKNRLESYGIPSINNIVDITNYVMVELGQPMHAQDIAKLEKPEIVIRRAQKGEKITTLLGEVVELDEQVFVLTQNNNPTVIGGVVGGVATGIDESTTEIILDAGNYNQVSVRKTSRLLKIQNETVLRYDKFLHPELTEVAIKRATKLILELAGGDYYLNTDWYPKKFGQKKLNVTFDRVKKIGGELPITHEFIEKTLHRLEYKILNKSAQGFTLEVPFFRTDIEVEDDVVSDVLRIYGYHKIPSQALNVAAPKDITQKIYKFEEFLRDSCVEFNMHEHITDPLVPFTETETKQVKLENSQSQLKNALRVSIYPGLKLVAENYDKHQINPARLFEIGKVYSKTKESSEFSSYMETRSLQAYIRNGKTNHKDNASEVRRTLDALLKKVGVDKYSLEQNDKIVEVQANNKLLGTVTWDGFALQTEQLLEFWNPKTPIKTDFETSYENDISLMVPSDIKLGKILSLVQGFPEFVKETSFEILPQNFASQDNSKKNTVLRIKHKFADFTGLREKIISELKTKLGLDVK
jgi:phenylalanyl-tRNA synthetase beta chain